jgi:three-Cys-motif partner protein
VPDETTVIASDGLPARKIKPHTREKFDRHGKYCGIFTRGMGAKWPSRLGYLELFAGSGLAVEKAEELDGCPLIAAAAEPGFARMALVEKDVELAAALQERLRRRGVGPERALVLAGDANDPFVLAKAAEFLPAPGLIYAFIDPEDINGHWDAIRFLSDLYTRRQRFDFLINLPVGSMKRNPGSDAITSVLGTSTWRGRVEAGEPLGIVIRETLAEQFRGLGFNTAEHMEIRAYENETPVYDLVFASRHERGIEFWRKIQAISPTGQRELKLFP